jgi:hypothetical protein
MTDKDYALIAIVADRSGSMGQPADPPVTKAQRTTEGVHSLVTEQRKVGRTDFILTDFDTDGMTKIPLGNGDEVLAWECKPRSGTPLLDAVGTTITEVGELLKAMPEDERPGRVIFVIATDGEENSSREYKREQVGKMIDEQRNIYGWDFVFIGADFDAFAEAGSFNIPSMSTMGSSGVAMAAAYSSTNSSITRNRLSGMSVGYNLAERSVVAQAEKSGGKFTSTTGDDDADDIA